MSRRSALTPWVWAGGLLVPALLFAAPARAALEGSPHDLIAQEYDVAKTSVERERCRQCHINPTPGLQPFAPEVPPVLGKAYGAASLTCFSCHDGTTIVSPDVDASRTAFHPSSHGNDLAGYEGLLSEMVGLPSLGGATMECITCHDPHDNGNRPFLRASLQELCLFCHSKYTGIGLGKENRTGNHVIGLDPAAAPREQVPLHIGDDFRVPNTETYPMARGKRSGAWHWNLGGHLSKGRSGAIGCATCHTVHGGEGKPPAGKLLAVEPVNESANLLCEGCHAGARGDGKPAPPHPNPGGTTTGRTYHPVDNDEANGAGRSLETREPPGWPFGGGASRPLLCTTCHAPHGAWAQTPLLRRPSTAIGFCEECHGQTPGNHHRAGILDGAANCGSRMPAPAYDAGGALVCSSCHRAHNAGLGQARESDYVPLLIGPSQNGELCETCHPAGNPTCGTDPGRLASHFLGDPTREDTYRDLTPPLRLDPWPESGLLSVYGGENGKAVTCLSCHSFRAGALVSGDEGDSRYLLARSGNGQEWDAGDETGYLCTGCHGARPGTGSGQKGHSHPMMDADIESLGREPGAPLSATFSGKMNCDSCHRAHNASINGGVYILEVAEGENADPRAIHPRIDYTALCHGCHEEKDY